MAKYHEAFALAICEPNIIFILGNKLFFNLFLPLHKSGNFKIFVDLAISKQIDYRDKFLNNQKNKKEFIMLLDF